MRKILMTTNAAIIVAAAPALPAPGGGGHGGGGGAGNAGGMGRSMGAGPPMSVPGQSGNPAGGARDIESQRGQFGRNFARQQQTRAEDVRRYQTAIARYEKKSRSHRDEALAAVAELKAGRGQGLFGERRSRCSAG